MDTVARSACARTGDPRRENRPTDANPYLCFENRTLLNPHDAQNLDPRRPCTGPVSSTMGCETLSTWPLAVFSPFCRLFAQITLGFTNPEPLRRNHLQKSPDLPSYISWLNMTSRINTSFPANIHFFFLYICTPIQPALKNAHAVASISISIYRHACLPPSHAFYMGALDLAAYNPHHCVLLSKWLVNGLNTACHSPVM